MIVVFAMLVLCLLLGWGGLLIENCGGKCSEMITNIAVFLMTSSVAAYVLIGLFGIVCIIYRSLTGGDIGTWFFGNC